MVPDRRATHASRLSVFLSLPLTYPTGSVGAALVSALGHVAGIQQKRGSLTIIMSCALVRETRRGRIVCASANLAMQQCGVDRSEGGAEAGDLYEPCVALSKGKGWHVECKFGTHGKALEAEKAAQCMSASKLTGGEREAVKSTLTRLPSGGPGKDIDGTTSPHLCRLNSIADGHSSSSVAHLLDAVLTPSLGSLEGFEEQKQRDDGDQG